MGKPKVFRPKTAVREEKRQAFEAVGRSFCKSLSEPITNSDSSAKRKFQLTDANGNLLPSGLVDLMLQVGKGNQLDSAALAKALSGKVPKRRITIEVVSAKGHAERPVGEVVVIDEAQGMSPQQLETALNDIAGDRVDLADGMVGRNLFGRGLSDVLRAHALVGASQKELPVIQTFDGSALTVAEGEWQKNAGWTITMDSTEQPGANKFKATFLSAKASGTAVRFVISKDARAQGCQIPEHPVGRLANFYMLRLIASDPNVELILRQFRAQGQLLEDRVEYAFPIGHVVDSFAKTFDPRKSGIDQTKLKVDFLVARADSARSLRGLSVDRDARENGLLIVDDLDAVYDLTFADSDWEREVSLSHIFGIVRINGLRDVLAAYLNATTPSSPLRPDRDGFNRDHEFSRALLDFLADQLRPIYEKERQRLEDKDKSKLSAETKKRIDSALRQLNKYFNRITELGGEGDGTDKKEIKKPETAISFFPSHMKLTVGRPRQALLLIRDDVVKEGAEAIASASDGLSVQPETERISKKETPRWTPHPEFYAIRFTVDSSVLGQSGKITGVVEAKNDELLEATLLIEDVLADEPIQPPENLEFRPSSANGRPNRKNNLVLLVNPAVIAVGHYVRVSIEDRVGAIGFLNDAGERCEEVDIKLASHHQLDGQDVLRIQIPWMGTGWNQRAKVLAVAKVGNQTFRTYATLHIDEPEDGGFFREVKYQEIDPKAPSQFAAGTITINVLDPLNRMIFGKSQEEFDRNLASQPEAQQRLASLLLEEASFRALEHNRQENRVHFTSADQQVTEVHRHIDEYKFNSAADVFRALAQRR